MSTQLGKYRLVRRLGAGGMGEVWEAVDPVLDRTVAVKLLHGRGGVGETDELVREAAAAAKVSHPHAVTVYDAVEADGRWFLVMEYVAGQSAAARVTEAGRLPWEEATRIARDAAAGLAAVHAAGLIHRDVKPANVLLTPDGVAKLADFGLARRAVRSGLTAGSQVVGTPHYMSPEQCWSEAADGRSDVYSLGATYFTLLTGRTPYEAGTDMAVMYAHCNADIPDPRDRRPEVPAACAAVVRRAMAKQPADRYPSADALRAALEQVLSGSLVPAPLPPPALLPPPTTAAGPVGRGRLTRRALLAAVPASAVAVGLTAYLWPQSEPADNGGQGHGGGHPKPLAWTAEWRFPASVVSLAIAPDGQRVAVTVKGPGDDRRNDAVDIRRRDGSSETGWPKPMAGAEGVAFSPDGQLLAVASRLEERVAVCRWAVGELAEVEGGAAGAVPGACAAAFSDDGEWLAVGSYVSTGARVRFWQADGRRWRLRHHYGADECTIWGFGFMPDSARLVAAVGGTVAEPLACAVRAFDPAGGEERPAPRLRLTRLDNIGPAAGLARRVGRVAVADSFVLDGKRSGGIRVYDLPAWTPVGQRLPLGGQDETPDPWAVALSADGEWVAAAAHETISLWRVATGQKTKDDIRKHEFRVTALAFTPDGTKLLSGGEDGLVLVHDVTELTR